MISLNNFEKLKKSISNDEYQRKKMPEWRDVYSKKQLLEALLTPLDILVNSCEEMVGELKLKDEIVVQMIKAENESIRDDIIKMDEFFDIKLEEERVRVDMFFVLKKLMGLVGLHIMLIKAKKIRKKIENDGRDLQNFWKKEY